MVNWWLCFLLAEYKARRGYILESLSQEESNFPIAFSILFYKDLEQVELLLRNIYRPSNYYCLHVDAGASKVRSNNCSFLHVNAGSSKVTAVVYKWK